MNDYEFYFNKIKEPKTKKKKMKEYDIEELNLKTKQSNQLKEIHIKTTKNLFREKDKSDNQTKKILNRLFCKYRHKKIIPQIFLQNYFS